MRAYVTGASGFVGGWLTAHLDVCGDEVEVLADGIDLLDEEALTTSIGAAAPDAVYHLAGFTHVGESWKRPDLAMTVNALGTLAVLEAARKLASPPRVLVVSSAEVYGGGDGTPLGEDAPLVPTTPYATSKIAAEYIAMHEAIGRGLEVVRVRPFNHVGPGQSDAFVVAGLAKRIATVETSGGGEIPVGNLASERDFTDVRDVVRAYRLLVLQGRSGDVYNVCSGHTVPLTSVLEALVELANVAIRPVVDPALVRPIDVPVLAGRGERLHELTGWTPEIPLADTLEDVLDYWRKRV